MAPRVQHPLFILCQREGCENVKQVRTRYEQRTFRYCSKACAASATADSRREACRAACRRVGLARGHQMKQQLLARVAHLTPLEAFRIGYLRGLGAKRRQVLKRRAA